MREASNSARRLLTLHPTRTPFHLKSFGSLPPVFKQMTVMTTYSLRQRPRKWALMNCPCRARCQGWRRTFQHTLMSHISGGWLLWQHSCTSCFSRYLPVIYRISVECFRYCITKSYRRNACLNASTCWTPYLLLESNCFLIDSQPTVSLFMTQLRDG